MKKKFKILLIVILLLTSFNAGYLGIKAYGYNNEFGDNTYQWNICYAEGDAHIGYIMPIQVNVATSKTTVSRQKMIWFIDVGYKENTGLAQHRVTQTKCLITVRER